ncbi:unnamed protein product [Sympodiomycopsis kandeliae]
MAMLHSLHDTDDALAELEILAQNQRKLNQLTSRMTGILSGFDQRLASLEGTMIPIHHRTTTMQRVEKNIDTTLEALRHTLGHFDVVEEEEPRILAGPDMHDIQPYIETMGRVVRGLEYLRRSDLKSQERVVLRMHDVIETGARNLTSLMREWVIAESAPIDPSDYVPQRLPLPILSGATLEAIIPILSYLKSLPTNPTNGYAPFLAALSSYSDIRGEYLSNSVSHLGQGLITYATERIGHHSNRNGGMASAFEASQEEEGGGYLRGGAGIRDWMKSILDMSENEHVILTSLLRGLNPPSSNSTISSTFSRLLKLLLKDFNTTLNQLHNQIKANLNTHTLFAFDLSGSMSDLYARWEVVIVKASGKSQQHEDENSSSGGGVYVLNEQLKMVKSTMTQVFSTFLDEIKALPRQRQGEVPSTSINEINYLGLAFIRQTCEYGDVIAPLLSSLGKGNWNSSSNAAPVLSVAIHQSEQSSILNQYLCDTLSTILDALQSRSKAIRQPSTASIFLLNNIGHLQRELKSASLLQDYLGDNGTSTLNTSFKEARKQYLDAWNPLVSSLMDENIGLNSSAGGSKSSSGNTSEKAQKEDAKQRFARFFESLEDLERLHMAYPLSRDDEMLRESLKREVLRLVLPLYSRFVSKQMAAHFSSNPSKHLRPEGEVEERLVRLYT